MKTVNKFFFFTAIILLVQLLACEKGYQPPECNYIIHIPDTAFKNSLLKAYVFHGDNWEGNLDYNEDGEICDGEAAWLEEFYISDLNVRSFEGIEHFVNLRELDCSGCKLESISFNSSSLVELRCNNNILTNLEVSKIENLGTLRCSGNKLSELDLSKNTRLRRLTCNNNLLTLIDVSNNINLTHLTIENNNISSINVDSLSKLEYLHFSDNQISTIDISKNINLRSIDFKGNPISEIDLSDNLDLTGIWFGDNPMIILDISENQKVNFLRNDGEFPFEKICVWTLPFPPPPSDPFTDIKLVNFPASFDGFDICN